MALDIKIPTTLLINLLFIYLIYPIKTKQVQQRQVQQQVQLQAQAQEQAQV